MTYEQLEVNTEIRLKEKQDGEGRQKRKVKCTVIAKYPHMCIVEDRKGGGAVSQLENSL